MFEWNPSYDFQLFDIREFSPLQMQEYGAQTSFRPSDPAGYVDFALSQIAGLMNPNNARPYSQRQFPSNPILMPPDSFFAPQESASSVRDRLRQIRDDADRMLKDAGGEDCPQGRNILGGCGPIVGSKPMKSDGDTQLATEGSKNVAKSAKEWIAALPAGSGVFLIAVVVIILLLLFVRR